MPSLQEQLQSLLPAWEQEQSKLEQEKQMQQNPKALIQQGAHLFQTTNNASRETFNFIRDNPLLKSSEIVKTLAKRGFKENTVSSLIYQMHTAELLRKDGSGRFTAVGQEFQPYNISKIRAERKRRQVASAKQAQLNTPTSPRLITIKRRTAQDVEAAQAAAGIGALVKPEGAWKPEHVVDTLTLQQAKAVYVYLKNSFGG